MSDENPEVDVPVTPEEEEAVVETPEAAEPAAE